MQLHILINNDKQYPQNLILSIIHQMFLKNSKITTTPSFLLSQISSQLQNQFQTNSINMLTEKEILNSICTIHDLQVYIYKDHHRQTYLSSSDTNTNQSMILDNDNDNLSSCQSKLEIYCEKNFYYSVLRSEIRQDSSVLEEVQKLRRDKFKLSTWNLRGVTNNEDQLLIDYMLRREGIDIIAIQESHLNCSKIETSSYFWFLGPQYQQRASRGVGFLISKSFFSQNDIEMIVVTPNIAYLTVKIPYVKSISIINIHKLNNNDPNSSLETGKFNV